MQRENSYHFGAGPALLPDSVLHKVQSELMNWGKTGISVLEMSHRSQEFAEISSKATENLRKLMSIPSSYDVLFLQGGARTQFAMLPMNICKKSDKSQYFISGTWSKIAAKEAALFSEVCTTDILEKSDTIKVKPSSEWPLEKTARYWHITNNETIEGIECHPQFADNSVPLVADLSSIICAREVDLNAYSAIYACAQKNLGPAGVTFVIIKKDFFPKEQEDRASMLHYANHSASKSLYNTSPVFFSLCFGPCF